MTTTYILLRNNKESGPLSLEDLKDLGLLADDLIWVEGQSVYWLSPGQIKELKDLVGAAPRPRPTEETDSTKEGEWAAYQPSTEKIQEKKSVEKNFKQESASQKSTIASSVKSNSAKSTIYASRPDSKNGNGHAATAEKKKTIDLNSYYAQQLSQGEDSSNPDPISYPRKSRHSFPGLPPAWRQAAIYGALLVFGLAAGVLVSKMGGKRKSQARQEYSQINNIPAAEQKTDSAVTIQPQTTIAVPPGEETVQNTINPPPTKTVTRYPEQKNSLPLASTRDDSVPSSPDLSKPEEKLPSEEIRPAKPKPENLSSQVSVKSNDYTVGSFGGIRNLELTVTNESKYALDKVVVELQYLKPRDELLKTELIYFHQIPPNGSQKLPVAKSSRGVKVAYRIVKIESKENGS